jgi:hypothetical protein
MPRHQCCHEQEVSSKGRAKPMKIVYRLAHRGVRRLSYIIHITILHDLVTHTEQLLVL